MALPSQIAVLNLASLAGAGCTFTLRNALCGTRTRTLTSMPSIVQSTLAKYPWPAHANGFRVDDDATDAHRNGDVAFVGIAPRARNQFDGIAVSQPVVGLVVVEIPRIIRHAMTIP